MQQQSHKNKLSHQATQAKRTIFNKYLSPPPTVIFNAIISPPRSGSTRIGLFIKETNADMLITEPLARFEAGEDRWNSFWIMMLQHIQDLEKMVRQEEPSRNLTKQPLNIVSKFISQHIGSEQELDDIIDMHQNIMLLTRNPLESIESNLLLVMDLVEILHHDENVNIPQYPDTIAQMKENGWIVSDADLSHLVEQTEHPENKSVWQQHVEWMKEHRNYSSLTGRMFLVVNGMFSTESLQSEVWEMTRKNIVRNRGETSANQLAIENHYDNWQDLVDQNYGKHLTDGTIPEILLYDFEHRQSGWDELGHIHARLQEVNAKYKIVDFGIMKLSPDEMRTALFDAFGLKEDVDKNVVLTDGYGQYNTDEHNDRVFGIAQQEQPLQLTFREFIPMANYPPFIVEHLSQYFQTYLKLLSNRNLVKTINQDRLDIMGILTPEQVLADVNIGMAANQEKMSLISQAPAYSYALIATSALGSHSLHPEQREVLLKHIRTQEPTYLQYYNMIDYAMAEISKKDPAMRNEGILQTDQSNNNHEEYNTQAWGREAAGITPF